MKKIIRNIVLVIIVVLVAMGGFVYYKINSPAFGIQKASYIYINEEKNYLQLMDQLKTAAHLKDVNLFERLAHMMKYSENVKSGRYEITPQTTYLEAIRMLRSGRQMPVKLTFNNIRLKEDLSERIGEQMLFDSDALLSRLNDPNVTASLGFDTITILAMFIPNTYEIYWNTPVDKFLERMKKEYNHFWTDQRREKANALHLSPVEVSTLASIVEEETALPSEYPIVSGLYINRLRKGMPLQADPTVKFAVGDVSLRRIANWHLHIESPYNTYLYSGLPPGPIRIPSIKGIDATLNYKEHNYLYMCAKEDFSGTHNFSIAFSEHLVNAKKYQDMLDRNHIW
ncbi:MAG: endolytic transglycosylase MltG [Candidatus Azobacteroides sp.]|nr:endolytic transglycosylase MltG [Candidatus Azobacteroides sp.]